MKYAQRHQLFDPKDGMSMKNLVTLINRRKGYAFRVPNERFGLAYMQEALSRGHKVAAAILTRQGDKHCIRIEGFIRGAKGKLLASIGDPWTGNSWRIPAEDLMKAIRKCNTSGVVVQRVPK